MRRPLILVLTRGSLLQLGGRLPSIQDARRSKGAISISSQQTCGESHFLLHVFSLPIPLPYPFSFLLVFSTDAELIL